MEKRYIADLKDSLNCEVYYKPNLIWGPIVSIEGSWAQFNNGMNLNLTKVPKEDIVMLLEFFR